jgi:hypothetical protein
MSLGDNFVTIEKDLSLEEVLENEMFRMKFKNFCKQERNEETIIFWEMVQMYKMSDRNELKDVFIEIYDEFFTSESKFELNIDSETREEIKKLKESMSLNRKSFDIILEKIKKDMIDSFSRFIFTEEYKNIQNLEVTTSEHSEIENEPKKKTNSFTKLKNFLSEKMEDIDFSPRISPRNQIEINEPNKKREKKSNHVPRAKSYNHNLQNTQTNTLRKLSSELYIKKNEKNEIVSISDTKEMNITINECHKDIFSLNIDISPISNELEGNKNKKESFIKKFIKGKFLKN